MSDDSPQTVTEKAAPYKRMRDQDQDKFGEIIKKFPIIWDSSHSECKNKRLKEATWDEISKIMDIDDIDLLKKYYSYRRDCSLKKFQRMKHNNSQKKRKLTYDSSVWSFLRKDFEHKYRQEVTSESKDFIGEMFANEIQKELKVSIRECTSQNVTETDILEPGFAFENVKRRKLDVETNHGSGIGHLPQTTEEDEDMKGHHDDTNYDDQPNSTQTEHVRSTMEKFATFHTDNGDEEHSRSHKQCRTEIKDQSSNYSLGSALRTFIETGLQQQNSADKVPTLVLDTAALGNKLIDPDEETRMNEELKGKYLYSNPSTSLSGQNTTVNPQKTNKEKHSDTKTSVKQSRTTKDVTAILKKRREVKVENNNDSNTSQIIDLTDNDLNDSKYEEDSEVNYREGGNSVWESNQLLDGDGDSKVYFKKNGEVIIQAENSVANHDEDEYEMNPLEPYEDEHIEELVNHPEEKFEGLEYKEEEVVNMTTMTKQQSGNSSKNSLDFDTNQAYLPVSQGKTNVQSPEQTQEPMSEEHHSNSISSLSLIHGETSKLPQASTVNERPRHPTQEVTEENNISNFQGFVINSLNQYITKFNDQQLLDFKIGVLEVVRKFVNK